MIENTPEAQMEIAAWNGHRAEHRTPIGQPSYELRRKSRREQTPHNSETWDFVLRILDNSELELRDMIERDLANIARVNGTRYVDAMRAIDRLIQKVTRLRVNAIKKAFRFVRDQS